MMTASLLAAAMRRKQTTPNTYSVSGSIIPNRILSLFDLVLLGVGATLGSGLFLLTGRAARNVAGPAVSVSFGLAAVACLFSALSYAEMSSRLPNSGGAYAFTYHSLGELPAFLVGMCLTLEYGVGSAAVARAWASYLGDTIQIFPRWVSGIGSQFSGLGALLIILLSVLLSFGLQHAKWLINMSTCLYGVVVIIIVTTGLTKINAENYDPFFPFGASGVITGASAVFFSFIGFDEVATLSEEAINASRDVPIAITVSLFVVTFLYIAASLVLTGAVNYKVIDLDAPFSSAMRTIGYPVIAIFVGIGTAIGMVNSTFVGFAAQPRVFVSMGRDGLLPRAFAFSTRTTTLGCGFIVSIMAFVMNTQALADLVSGGTLLAFLSTNLSVLLTRCRIHTRARQGPVLIYTFAGCLAIVSLCARLVIMKVLNVWVCAFVSLPLVIGPVSIMLTDIDFEGGDSCERSPPSFLCPIVPIFPMLGVATTIFLLFQLSIKALSTLILWLTMSMFIYFMYSAKNAIIANEYHAVGNSPSHSFNSFEDLAMEANSVADSDEKNLNDVPDVVVMDNRTNNPEAGQASSSSAHAQNNLEIATKKEHRNVPLGISHSKLDDRESLLKQKSHSDSVLTGTRG